MRKRKYVVWQKKLKKRRQINTGKTKVMRVNNKNQDPVKLHHEEIKEVDKFVSLGSVISKDGGTDQDIKSRINKARHVFNTFDKAGDRKLSQSAIRSGFSTLM